MSGWIMTLLGFLVCTAIMFVAGAIQAAGDADEQLLKSTKSTRDQEYNDSV